MAARQITPQKGRIYRRNLVECRDSGSPDAQAYLNRVRGVTFRVERVSGIWVIGVVVQGNHEISAGSALNPRLRHFTTQYFDEQPVG